MTKTKKQTQRLKVGVFAITGCYGCLLSVIFNEKELLGLNQLINIQAFPFIKEKIPKTDYDIILLEGTVIRKEDLKTLKRLRKKTKVLVALGACSSDGGVPTMRNFMDKRTFKPSFFPKVHALQDLKPMPIDNYVKVDYYLPGCPPSKREILRFLKEIALGKKPRPWTEPVCYECRLNRNKCLFIEGKPCLGLITRGGCNAVCINGGFECWGCRGPTDDANIELTIRVLKGKGYDEDFIRKRIETFVGLKMRKREEEERKHKTWTE